MTLLRIPLSGAFEFFLTKEENQVQKSIQGKMKEISIQTAKNQI